MASQATNLVAPLNVAVKTVAQWPNQFTSDAAISAAFSITLYTTPGVLSQATGPGATLSYWQTNRYRLSVYLALVKASQQGGQSVGPIAVTFNDGNGAKSFLIGYNGANPLLGEGFDKPMKGNQPGNLSSIMAGKMQFVAAPGTAITVSIPYSGSGQYMPNIALETF